MWVANSVGVCNGKSRLAHALRVSHFDYAAEVQLRMAANDKIQKMADFALSAKIELARLRKMVKGKPNTDKVAEISSLVDECFRTSELTPPFDTDDD